MAARVRRVAETDPVVSVRAAAQYVDAWLGGLPALPLALTPNPLMQPTVPQV